MNGKGKLSVRCPHCDAEQTFWWDAIQTKEFGYECPSCKRVVHVAIEVKTKLVGGDVSEPQGK